MTADKASPIVDTMVLKKSSPKPNHYLGILGGGQLGRMLALSAYPLGYTPVVLAGSYSDPAAQVCPKTFLMSQLEQCLEFFKIADMVTFESEFFPLKQMLKDLKINTDHIKFLPSLTNIETLQFRHSQKQVLEKFKVPTLQSFFVQSPSDLRKALELFQGNLVLKKNFGGYDGYGTFYINPKLTKKLLGDLKNLEFSRADQTNPLLQALINKNEFIAEPLTRFKRELACVFVSDCFGKSDFYPLVETVQKDSKCYYVHGPIKHKDFSNVAKKIQIMLKKIGYVGALGVEFFDLGEKLIVNELAPRVHNTGHYTQNACTVSQFSAHVRTVMGENLPEIATVSQYFAMYNILGKNHEALSIRSLPKNFKHNWQLHLYGKSESRKGRKMGHINFVDQAVPIKQSLVEKNFAKAVKC